MALDRSIVEQPMSTAVRTRNSHSPLWATKCLLVAAVLLQVPFQASHSAQGSSLPAHLVVAVVEDAEPLEGVEEGRLAGFSGELLSKLLAKSGVALEARPQPRRDVAMRAACNGEVDLVMGAVPFPEYAHCLVYSAGYLERNALVVARMGDERALAPGFLDHATVITESGAPWGRELKAQFPDIQLIEVDSVRQAMATLAAGNGDVFIGAAARLNRVLREPGNERLHSLRRLDLGHTAYRFAAPVNRSETIRELDRRLALLPEVELERLRDDWLLDDPDASASSLALSAKEHEVLSAQKTIHYTVTSVSQPPFATEDSRGVPSGLTIDYLTYLGRLLDIDLVYVPTVSLEQALTRVQQGKIDLIAGSLGKRDLLATPLLTGGTYATAPLVIVTATSAPYISTLDGVRGKRVAVVDSDPLTPAIRISLPVTHLVTVDDMHQGLDLVRANGADAMIGNLTTMDALVRGQYGGDLRIGGAIGFDEKFGLWGPARLAPLLAILERALAAIPELERNRIERRWTLVGYQFDTPWTVLLARYWSLILLGSLALLALVVSHLRLRQHVRHRRESEARLEHELALKEALLACLPEPIAAKDAELRYVALNPAFEKFFGVRKEDYLGSTLRPRPLPSDSIEALVTLQDEALGAMEARHLLLPLENAAGQLRTVIAWAVPFRNRDGSGGGVVTMYLDVTDIHEARQRARLVELRLRDVTESLPAVVLQIRCAPGQPWELTYLAGNAEETFGSKAPPLMQDLNIASRLLERDDFLRIREALAQAGDVPVPIELELKLSKDLGERWAQFRAMPRREGDFTVWSGVFSDVTGKHQQAEALLVAKEGAEAALRTKEGFLAMMSHEIRTPMNGVLGLVELLQNTDLSVEQHRMLALAQESGLALAQILDDILDYAKIEAGRLSIMRAPLDLRELLDSVMSLLLPQAHDKGLQLRQTVGADVPAMILADGIRVRQILLNLFGNAIKFTEQGSVTLHASVESNGDDSAVLVVTVADTGIGIPKDDIQRLFAPFVQSERSSTRRFGGTGLGLSISRRLAQMMDGQLTLESEEGVGTTAFLRVPCSVLNTDYELPLLKGRPVMIRVRSALAREALAAHARVAGMQVLDGDSSPPTDAIHFVDMDHPEDAGNARHVILVSAVPKQLGFRAHAGTVRLSTNPLRWTAFLGALEALLEEQTKAPEQVKPGVPEAQSAAALARRKVLVAEDHPINREVIQQQLQLLGYAATVVVNGEQALRALETETFDMVITDCHMPVLDGFDLTRAIRASPRADLSSIPVVGVTATTVREELLRCFEVGMNTYVLKPTTLASLQKALSEVAEELADASEEVEATVPVTDLAGACESFDPAQIDAGAIQAFLSSLLANVKMRQDYWKSLRDDRQALCACLENGSNDDLRAWCHRAKGALSLFGQPCIDQLMDQFHRLVAQAPAPATVKAAASGILRMYDQLFSILDS